MKKIVIIGCGLIGGSFAALAKENDCSVHGIGRREVPLSNAKENQLIDSYSLDLEPSIIENSDYIIIASPISTVIPIIETLTNTFKKTLKIIEFSSVKSFLNHPIVQDSHHQVIAAHPMGGSDVQGLENASSEILRNRSMIVFDDNQEINKFFELLSFQCIHCESFEIHDQWMSHISHGPYLISTLLPAILSKYEKNYLEQLKQVSAGGFRDTTRVSNSPIEWGLDILNGNQNQITTLIDDVMDQLSTIKKHLTESNNNELTELLSNAKNTRQTIVSQ